MFFSVIVPIYKVEKYLARCIESVLSQTFGDFELILVDDGSPDKCPEICDEYEKKDNRILVIHKENGGLVSARQAGIKAAKGEYVLNLDSDDAIESYTLQSAYDIIQQTDTDIISFSLKHYINGEKGEPIYDALDEGLYCGEDLEKKVYPKLLSDRNMNHIIYYLSGKIIRRALVTPNQLNVSTKISLGEDLMCVVPCYLQAEKIFISKISTYLYTIRDDSISASFNTRQITQVSDVVNSLKEFDVTQNIDFAGQIDRYSFFMSFAILASAADGNHFDAVSEIKKLILSSGLNSGIQKAEFDSLTAKSRVTLILMKKGKYKLAFNFLYVCKEIKRILKGKGRRT